MSRADPSPLIDARAPQYRADARDELFEAERFGDVVVAADREPLHLLLGRVPRGQEHHRYVMPVGPEPLHDRKTVAVGEHDVEHHEIRAERRRGLQGVGPGACDLDVEAFVAQGGRDEVGDVRLVVDDEDSCISHPFMVAPHFVRMLCAS